MKAKFQIESQPSSFNVSGHYRCVGCSVCQLAMQVRSIEFPEIGFTYQLRNFSNCNTKMSVYLLICVCQKRYIGSTCRKIKVRIQEHRSYIRHQVLEAPLVHHFVNMNHTDSDFKFLILETLAQKPREHRALDMELLRRETFWIFKLNTVVPNGLNLDIDYSVYL